MRQLVLPIGEWDSPALLSLFHRIRSACRDAERASNSRLRQKIWRQLHHLPYPRSTTKPNR